MRKRKGRLGAWVVLGFMAFVGFVFPALGQELRSGEPLEIEIRADDPSIPERGPSRTIPYTATGQGRIYIHALSEDLDLWLRVEDGKGKVLVEDDDSGGGTTPHVELDVTKGHVVRIVVARSVKVLGVEGETEGRDFRYAGTSSATELVTVKLYEARETDETLAAAKRAEVNANRAKLLGRREDREGARTVLARTIEALMQTAGVEASPAIVNGG